MARKSDSNYIRMLVRAMIYNVVILIIALGLAVWLLFYR